MANEHHSSFKHTAIVGAVGAGYKDGRLAAFWENPCEETMMDILNAAEKEMRKLIKKYPTPTKAAKANGKASKTKGPVIVKKKAKK